MCLMVVPLSLLGCCFVFSLGNKEFILRRSCSRSPLNSRDSLMEKLAIVVIQETGIHCVFKMTLVAFIQVFIRRVPFAVYDGFRSLAFVFLEPVQLTDADLQLRSFLTFDPHEEEKHRDKM